ncbi:type I-D CRISPR-associated protein Cas5/Csc1 [Staphylospora marina]|uniref:type I-D CRISPR-associated protein Cas5/Csc1 n=1 Tax=Staphylospora marina TaxID=2490858 RepID=UPI0013DDA635|nr:type I-D CRISPR-associated protein Cas5/Csc1 [Staphylospora marina]
MIELEDFLFFSSMEKGKVAETAPLLHNYALAYAMSWAVSPYYHEHQAPEYERHLQPLNHEGIYIFPASPVEVTHRLMQYNTTPEPFLMTRAQSLGYPNWGFIKCIRPGSRFETYALSYNPLSFPSRIRLGKWMSQARLEVEEVDPERGKGKHCPAMINVQDLPKIPTYFTSMYNVLPTRLVMGAEWENEVEGYWVGEVFLPEAVFWWR